ncbi:MAG: GNAT family N-acetyltransferase [Clostridiales bacterium]|nr:GNAT family N-acetyltransferase [Clostridiales bacterium]
MKAERLYRVKREDLPKLQELLTECFREDPLYNKLIPDDEIREKLLPHLFHSDLLEYFKECEIYADSKELNSVIVISDESEVYSAIHYYMTELAATIRTDSFLILEDPSLKTLHNFIVGKEYLNSKWTDELHNDKRLHVIYLASRPSMQHHGLSGHLLNEVIEYADREGLMVSLETHNDKNLPFYQHHGFEVFEVIDDHFDLTQYCLIRKCKTGEECLGEQHIREKVV